VAQWGERSGGLTGTITAATFAAASSKNRCRYSFQDHTKAVYNEMPTPVAKGMLLLSFYMSHPHLLCVFGGGVLISDDVWLWDVERTRRFSLVENS
jgi:hypothetical protein